MLSAKWTGKFVKGTDRRTFHITFYGDCDQVGKQIHDYVAIKEEQGWKLTENSVEIKDGLPCPEPMDD